MYTHKALYIPPLWFHHVLSETANVAANVFTDSVATAARDAAFNGEGWRALLAQCADSAASPGAGVTSYKLQGTS